VDVDRRTVLTGALVGVAALATGCSQGERQATPVAPTPSRTSPSSAALPMPTPAAPTPMPPTAEQVLARATVPVLCYHQLRDWRPADDDYARRLLICPPAVFPGAARRAGRGRLDDDQP
jgi:hypothetical protein